MSDNHARIKLRIGQFEVEYEGRESFLSEDIFHLMEKAVDFHVKHGNVLSAHPSQNGDTNDDDRDNNGEGSVGISKEVDLAVSTIARQLDAKTGPELAIAAAAYLTLVKEKDRFSRQEILDTMKMDSGTYKKTMSSNLTSSLKSLIKSRHLNEISDGRYTLSSTEVESVKSTLAIDA